VNLSGAAAGTSQTLNVSADTTSQETDITNFVTAYNTLVSTMNSLSSFNSSAATGTQAGPLLGDSTLQTIQNTLSNLIGTGVQSGGTTVSLATIGIKLQSDGTLSVNTATLDSAVQNNPTAITALFTATGSLGQQLNSSITGFTQTGGIIDNRTDAINANITSVKAQQATLATYAAQLTAQYNSEFTALNSLMAQTNSDSQYLTQLFGGANSAGALASANNQ
jgi:flagellar hook-associated protein 2